MNNNNHANDVLLKALEDDAKAQSSRIVKAAEDAALEIMRQARAEVSAFESDRKDALAKLRARARASRMSAARLRARVICLEARHKAIDEVFRAAAASVGGLSKPAYAALIRGLYDGLKSGWNLDEPPVVYVRPTDIGLIPNDGFDVKPDAGVGFGVVFASKDNRVRYENTVESRIKMMKANLVPVIDRLLFAVTE